VSICVHLWLTVFGCAQNPDHAWNPYRIHRCRLGDLDLCRASAGGKVFAFGPPRSEAENLAAVPPAGDDAFIEIRRSVLSWPTPFDFNFMTGHSPSWKRHIYYRLLWKKPSGAKLEMLWRYEQYFYPANGWGSGFMTKEGSTGLVEVEIRP